ncbi:hypothetical protein DENSPDRAFT_563891 [Dentipellis sp. KUC8613]|nr:hypothetical protein DENSPDRAFT_563891 [Dentipellis sp. KUC8613]
MFAEQRRCCRWGIEISQRLEATPNPGRQLPCEHRRQIQFRLASDIGRRAFSKDDEGPQVPLLLLLRNRKQPTPRGYAARKMQTASELERQIQSALGTPKIRIEYRASSIGRWVSGLRLRFELLTCHHFGLGAECLPSVRLCQMGRDGSSVCAEAFVFDCSIVCAGKLVFWSFGSEDGMARRCDGRRTTDYGLRMYGLCALAGVEVDCQECCWCKGKICGIKVRVNFLANDLVC